MIKPSLRDCSHGYMIVKRKTAITGVGVKSIKMKIVKGFHH